MHILFMIILTFSTFLLVDGQKIHDRTHQFPGRVKTLTLPDGTTDIYNYDPNGRVSAVYHGRNGYTDTYTYYPGYYEVVTKDSVKSPPPTGGYLRVELVNTLISSYSSSQAKTGPKSASFIFDNEGRLISRKLHEGQRSGEEYKYFYGAKAVLDSMHVYAQQKLKQRIIYEYDFKLPNALTDHDFGYSYHGKQTVYPASRRWIYNVSSTTPVTEYFKYELDANRRIRKMTVSSSAMKEQQVTQYTYY